MNKPLDAALLETLYQIMRHGYSFVEQNQPKAAEACFLRAWQLLPEPRFGWDVSEITVTRIARFYRDSGNFEEALIWGARVFDCNPLPNDGSPYVLLGSIYYESGDPVSAKTQFSKALAISGRRTFSGDGAKYLPFALMGAD